METSISSRTGRSRESAHMRWRGMAIQSAFGPRHGASSVNFFTLHLPGFDLERLTWKASTLPLFSGNPWATTNFSSPCDLGIRIPQGHADRSQPHTNPDRSQASYQLPECTKWPLNLSDLSGPASLRQCCSSASWLPPMLLPAGVNGPWACTLVLYTSVLATHSKIESGCFPLSMYRYRQILQQPTIARYSSSRDLDKQALIVSIYKSDRCKNNGETKLHRYRNWGFHRHAKPMWPHLRGTVH